MYGIILEKKGLRMLRKWLYTIVLLLVGALGLNAQEHVEKPDTFTVKPKPLQGIEAPVFSNTLTPYFFSPRPDRFETKEERAARINLETFHRVMSSVRMNLQSFTPPARRQFITSPYQSPLGTVPVMNATNPFIYARTPGMAPYAYPYSPDAFPQSIRVEFDFTSGTYRQVMVKWDDLEKSMARSFGGPYRNEPIPRMRFTSTDDLILY